MAVVTGVIVVAGALTVGAVAHGATHASTSARNEAKPVSSSSAGPTASNPSPSAKLVTVAIGDSIMDGHGLGADQNWPDLLADAETWNMHNLATDGSGYVTLGDARDTFQDQAERAVALDPDIVVIAGSSNDLGDSDTDVDAAIQKLVTTVKTALPKAKIIAFNTFWGDTTPPAQLASFNAQVKQSVEAVGGTYYDIGQPLSGRADLMQSDDVHPTAAGQKIVADAVAAKLAR